MRLAGDFDNFSSGATVIAVVALESALTDSTAVELSAGDPANSLALNYDGAGQQVVWQTPGSTASSVLNTGTLLNASTYELLYTDHDGSSNLTAWRGGVEQATGSAAAIPTVSRTSNLLGGSSAGSDYLPGRLAELLVYTKQLSTTERRAIEDYVQAKYGLAIELAPPAVSPAAGSYGTAQTITLTTSNAPTGYEIRYTLDGSTPTGTSTLYSSGFQLDRPTTVKARVFATGYSPSATTSAVYQIGDTDADDMLDTFEQQIVDADTGDAITTVSHVLADDDFDQDGLSNMQEYLLGSDPTSADSNGDGISDQEAFLAGLDLNATDYDGDTLSNTDEAAQGTDPFLADTDGDGVNDNLDDFPLDPSKSSGDAGGTGAPVITILEPESATTVP